MMDNSNLLSNSSSVNLEQYWLEQIKLKQESGLSRSAYCRKHNLICSRFTYWEKKLSQEKLHKLIPIKLEQNLSKPTTLCTLKLKNGCELQIHNLGVLPTLLSILG